MRSWVSNMDVDQSLYIIEQRLVTAVWLHERPYSGDTMETVKVKFWDRFGVEQLRKATTLGWEKHDFATDSVKDRPWLDRLTMTCLANDWYHNCNKQASKTLFLAIGWSTTTLCLEYVWFPERDLSRVVDWKRFAWPPRSPDLTTPDNALWGFIKESQQNAVLHNRSVTGSYRRSLHSRDPGLSAQNIYQNMAQNSTVLWQWRSPYRCSELLSHQVHAHIKHSTITATVSKINGGYAHFLSTLYFSCLIEFLEYVFLVQVDTPVLFCSNTLQYILPQAG
jgi:hypothetical protein